MLNPLTFISKFIRSSNQKELDRLEKIVQKVNSLEDTKRGSGGFGSTGVK